MRNYFTHIKGLQSKDSYTITLRGDGIGVLVSMLSSEMTQTLVDIKSAKFFPMSESRREQEIERLNKAYADYLDLQKRLIAVTKSPLCAKQ